MADFELNADLKISSETRISGKSFKDVSDKTEGEINKSVKEIFGLPKTKQLIYYKDIRNVESKVNIKDFSIEEMFDLGVSSKWCLLRVRFETGDDVLIHSGYFAEMQGPRFIDNIKISETKLLNDQKGAR